MAKLTDREVRQKIVDFFKSNPNPGDDQVHELAESLGINPHKFETIIYSLLTQYIQGSTKRSIIACLVRAGRHDLADAMRAG
jgi:hypothetical protein